MYFTLREAEKRSLDATSGGAFGVERSLFKHSELGKDYDVFLSHSFSDRQVLDGVVRLIESQGVSVYIDWRDDPLLDRRRVTAESAEHLRRRMDRCRSLIFATSQTSSKSVWMPWELGYFDGRRNGRVAVMPLVRREGDTWSGQEYLGLYPVVDRHAFGGHMRVFNKVTDREQWPSLRAMAGY